MYIKESNSFISLVLKTAVCHPPLLTIFCSTEVTIFNSSIEFINIASVFFLCFGFLAAKQVGS